MLTDIWRERDELNLQEKAIAKSRYSSMFRFKYTVDRNTKC
jgi:hypothetical protein